MLRDAVAFGLPHEARRAFDAEEGDLLLEIVSEVVGAVVVPQSQPARDAVADALEAFAHALADRLQGLEAGPEELRLALLAFKRTYNEQWMLEKYDYRSPAQVRRDLVGLDAVA